MLSLDMLTLGDKIYEKEGKSADFGIKIAIISEKVCIFAAVNKVDSEEMPRETATKRKPKK